MTNNSSPVLKIIVAMDFNGSIGAQNRIPWKIKSDLKRFKELTTGHTVLMGRKTCESIISYAKGPLKNRRNIVLSRDNSFSPEGFEVVRSWEEFMSNFRSGQYGDVFVIGGAEIYRCALQHADLIYITRVCAIISRSDTSFPKFRGSLWKIAEQSKVYPASPDDEFSFYYETLKRS